MKRIACLMMLTALSSPASARDSFSFIVHGHRVHIEASRNCRSLSCISVSVPGLGNWHRGQRGDDDVASVNDSAPPLPPAPAGQVAPPPPAVAPPQTRPVYAPPVVQAAAPPAPQAMRAQTLAPAQPAPVMPAQQVAPPVQAQSVSAPTLAAVPSAPPAPVQVAPPPSAVGFEVPKPQAVAVPDKPAAQPQDTADDRPVVEKPAPRITAQVVARVSQPVESEAADSPIGDWQTEGKGGGLVRIEACGSSLCGYVLNFATRAKGESVLVNMKPKKDNQWTGNVFSRSSGNSYYGTMTLKDGDTLRVEACAVGSYFCSGNNWTRIELSRSIRPDSIANSRHEAQPPRS